MLFTIPQSLLNGTPPCMPSGIQQLCIDVEDVEDANILEHFPAITDFVAPVMNNKSDIDVGDHRQALIHCAQGTSRSIAAAMACLIRFKGLDVEGALTQVQSTCGVHACPNSGFMHQLELYFAMGCRLNIAYQPYRRFLTTLAAEHYMKTGSLEVLNINGLCAPEEEQGKLKGEANPRTIYRCRSCRLLIATSENLMESSQEQEARGFAWKKRDSNQQNQQNQPQPGGGGIFVEPLRWMSGIVDGAVQGKLYCPKCSSRLGTFSWAGLQGSDGGWVTPGFHLHLSKLDAEGSSRSGAPNDVAGNPLYVASLPKLMRS
jgi:dual specificity phosphatase 12